jgi:hypothetical protein
MRLAGRVAHIGEMRNAYKLLVGIPVGKRHFGNTGDDWRIILNRH